MESILNVRYVIVFQKEDLQWEELQETLKEYGTIAESYDDVLDCSIPVKVVLMESDMARYFKFKLEFNCVEQEDNKYVLFPMASLQDKAAVLAERSRA